MPQLRLTILRTSHLVRQHRERLTVMLPRDYRVVVGKTVGRRAYLPVRDKTQPTEQVKITFSSNQAIIRASSILSVSDPSFLITFWTDLDVMSSSLSPKEHLAPAISKTPSNLKEVWSHRGPPPSEAQSSQSQNREALLNGQHHKGSDTKAQKEPSPSERGTSVGGSHHSPQSSAGNRLESTSSGNWPSHEEGTTGQISGSTPNQIKHQQRDIFHLEHALLPSSYESETLPAVWSTQENTSNDPNSSPMRQPTSATPHGAPLSSKHTTSLPAPEHPPRQQPPHNHTDSDTSRLRPLIGPSPRDTSGHDRRTLREDDADGPGENIIRPSGHGSGERFHPPEPPAPASFSPSHRPPQVGRPSPHPQTTTTGTNQTESQYTRLTLALDNNMIDDQPVRE